MGETDHACFFGIIDFSIRSYLLRTIITAVRIKTFWEQHEKSMSLPDHIASCLIEANRDINTNLYSLNYWMYTASVQL